MRLVCRQVVFVFCLLFIFVTVGFCQKDPGPRGGPAGAGGIFEGTTDPGVISFFNDGLARFQEVETVTSGPNIGLGPAFNSNQCSSCHAQPAVGGTSPATNPQIAVARLDGAQNVIPSFITINGPVREARFKFMLNSYGFPEPNMPDGGVHDLFTIQGRTDAPGCVLAQPNFVKALAQNNVIFRIPTPTFGAGLIENIDEETIVANQIDEDIKGEWYGIHGVPNRSGNDGTITRFGWKAQNKSLMMFAGEAYNVEMGISNELFQNKRGFPPTPPPASCVFNPTPDDKTNFDQTIINQVPSDVVAFADFMRFLDQPTPGPSSPSTINGFAQFKNVGCALCHTPSLMTGQSSENPVMSGVEANLFSDLLIHHMGSNLADGIAQGQAGPDQFRTAPLWGVGQRLFFLHDGRTTDLLNAIEQHKSQGSEANKVIENFNSLTPKEQQDLLNFLRSL